MSPGAAVTWKGQRTFVRSLETITRADRTPLECAVLECNRFAAVADLVPGHGQEETKPRSVGFSPAAARRQLSDESDAKERSHEKPEAAATPAKAPKESRGDRVADASSIPVPSPCNILAVDFLNVLVRAYHAGKPTETHAVRSLFQTVANAIRKIKPAHVVFAMDGGHDLRSQLLPEYKAHRPESEPLLKSQKELAERALQIAGFQCIRVNGWEADDVLASLAMAFSDTVIVSSDKDLLVMPSQADRCRIYHPWGEGSFATAEEKLEIPSHLVTDYLALCGDPSDGIPGVKGIGPKTAATLLQEHDSLENILAAATLGQIKAKATCQNLKEQREAALLCRRVVELNSRLPLPELASWRPATGWQQRLTDLRLGSVAAIMDSIKDQRLNTPQRSESPNQSAATEQAELFGRDEFSSDQPAVDPPSDCPELQPVQPSRERRPEFREPVEPVAPAETGGGDTAAAGSADEDWLRKQYEQGQRCRDRGTENPWKRDTHEHRAWDQGFRNAAFDLSPSTSSKPEPALKSTSGSLF